ncbi:MAG: hypothetical protein AAF662_05225 [Pseudomonadota bacterium]
MEREELERQSMVELATALTTAQHQFDCAVEAAKTERDESTDLILDVMTERVAAMKSFFVPEWYDTDEEPEDWEEEAEVL